MVDWAWGSVARIHVCRIDHVRRRSAYQWHDHWYVRQSCHTAMQCYSSVAPHSEWLPITAVLMSPYLITSIQRCRTITCNQSRLMIACGLIILDSFLNLPTRTLSISDFFKGWTTDLDSTYNITGPRRSSKLHFQPYFWVLAKIQSFHPRISAYRYHEELQIWVQIGAYIVFLRWYKFSSY